MEIFNDTKHRAVYATAELLVLRRKREERLSQHMQHLSVNIRYKRRRSESRLHADQISDHFWLK